MKYLKFAVFFITLFLLSSCGGNFEDLTQAANKIATYCGTNDVKVNSSVMSHLGDKTVSSYTIIIAGVKKVNEDNYPSLLVASKSAKILYDTLSEEQRRDKNAITVKIVKTNGAEEFAYPFAEIKKIDGLIKVSSEAILKIKNKDYEGLYNSFLDKTTIAKDVYYNNFIDKIIMPNQKIFGKIGEIEIAGFNFKKDSNLNLIEIFAVTVVGTDRITYQFEYKNEKNPKIAGIWVRN